MINILCLIAFSTLVIFGIHAVTRPKMLLWFLAVRVHLRDELADLEQELEAKKMADFDNYDACVQAIYEKYEDELNGENAQNELSELKSDYEKRKKEIESSYDLGIADLQKRIEFTEGKKHIKCLLKIAPMLTECVTCMASFWGGTMSILFFSGLFEFYFLFVPVILPFCILAIAGLNFIVAKKIKQ